MAPANSCETHEDGNVPSAHEDIEEEAAAAEEEEEEEEEKEEEGEETTDDEEAVSDDVSDDVWTTCSSDDSDASYFPLRFDVGDAVSCHIEHEDDELCCWVPGIVLTKDTSITVDGWPDDVTAKYQVLLCEGDICRVPADADSVLKPLNHRDLRFVVGDSVECCGHVHLVGGVDEEDGLDWLPGVVTAVKYSELHWPPNLSVPYQIRLNQGGRLIFASQDADVSIRAAAAPPLPQDDAANEAVNANANANANPAVPNVFPPSLNHAYGEAPAPDANAEAERFPERGETGALLQLLHACRSSKVGRVEALLTSQEAADAGLSANSHNALGNTGLIIAGSYGYYNLAAMLLERGARVNHANIFGGTALHCAAQWGFLHLCLLFIAHGADPTLRTNNLDPSPMCRNVDVFESFGLCLEEGWPEDGGLDPEDVDYDGSALRAEEKAERRQVMQAAREVYLQQQAEALVRRREDNWHRRSHYLTFLACYGFRLLHRHMPKAGIVDTAAKIAPVKISTKEQYRDFLLAKVFGDEGISRHIAALL